METPVTGGSVEVGFSPAASDEAMDNNRIKGGNAASHTERPGNI
ncbi:MAG: hypothetical protein V3S63_03485 [bacterium]